MSGPGDDAGEDEYGGTGSGDATQRLPGQPGAAGNATQRLPSQPGGASSSPIDPDADLKHSKLVGYMSVPVHRLLPIRRSTLLMVVAFIGFGILLYLYPPQSAPVVYTGPNGEQYNLTPVPVTTTTTSTTTTQPTTTSTTGPTATTRPVTTTTSAGHATTTTAGQSPGSSTTVPESTTTTQVGSSGSTTTTQAGTSKTGTTTTTAP